MRTMTEERPIDAYVPARARDAFEASGEAEPPQPMQIFFRLGLLMVIALGAALAAQC